MALKHLALIKNDPVRNFRCENIFLNQLASQKEGTLKISSVSLPSDEAGPARKDTDDDR